MKSPTYEVNKNGEIVSETLSMTRTKSVLPNLKGEWDVMDGEHQVSHHSSLKQAISHATSLAQQDHSELVIYGRDGKLKDRISFGDIIEPEAGTEATGIPSNDENDRNSSHEKIFYKAGPNRPVTANRRDVIGDHSSGKKSSHQKLH